MSEDAPVNIGAALGKPFTVKQHVLSMQSKLHCWAAADRGRRFDDLFNLVADPYFLVYAWERVRNNKGARTAGIDNRTATSIENSEAGVEGFLEDLRVSLKARAFQPVPVRETRIPKANGKLRSLGIPTVADRVVQAALKLVLEPIFEADFSSHSYGFRPNRRAQDAVQDIRQNAMNGYVWVFETDIAACFDEIDHTALMERVRGRISDKRVLALVKSFLRAGVLGEDGVNRDTFTGTPQGGILSPLLANIALTGIDDHFDARWAAHRNSSARDRHRKRGGATYRMVRYADDFVVMVSGTEQHAQALHGDIVDILAPLGLRMAPDKTRIVHIDEGFDFLGFHIQRNTQWGSTRRYIYSQPSRKSVAAVRHKIKVVTKQISHQPADVVFRHLNQIVRGWAQYFRFSCAARDFCRLHHYLWWRVWSWAVHKHPRQPRGWIWARYHVRRWPQYNGIRLFDPSSMLIQRYRYRGSKIPNPWNNTCAAPAA